MQNVITELLAHAQTPATVLRNPRVSAILVNNKFEIIAKGVHRGKGSPHAEIDLLNQVSGDLSEFELFISLEPCNHSGTTPPCSEAIIKRGIKRVTIASLDINPVSHGGISHLKSAGISVRVLGNQSEFYDLNFRWFESLKLSRPFVSAKLAMSLDGYISKNRSARYQITDQMAMNQVQKLRSQFDSILIGTNTAMVDDPFLTIRNKDISPEQAPLRVVMGKRELSDDLNIFNNQAPTSQICTHDPNKVLEQLREQGINTVLIEGGSTIFTSFFQEDLVDEINLFVSSEIFGEGLQLVPQLLPSEPKREMRIRKVLAWGPDIQIQIQIPRGL
jgi:diaminohydroxyphosphoribosylaminopyrimidine deaminase/5-amino-6-(5-phosphoribosylamino)uracil reductase